MPAISVAKALKLKNRLAGRMTKTTSNIQSYNSALEGQAQMDVSSLVKEREELMDTLIALKTAIVKTNGPIQGLIIRKGELKAKIEYLNSVNTTDGVQRHSYQNTEVKYVAFLKLTDVSTEVRKLETEIDAIQDKLDEYNHTAKIEVEQRWLDLAA